MFHLYLIQNIVLYKEKNMKYNWYLLHRSTGLILGSFGLVTTLAAAISTVGKSRMSAREVKSKLFDECRIKGLRESDFRIFKGNTEV